MKVLAISAHPDDETLGCGATLLKHRQGGDDLFWLIATEAHEPQWSAEMVIRKAAEVESVAQAYRIEQFFKLGFPTVQLDTIPQTDLIDRIREVISRVKPEIVYLVHAGDVHTDHQAVFTATLSALKAFHVARLGVRRLLCYETMSSTEAAAPRLDRAFMPNVFSDITPFIDSKIKVMKLYESEAQGDPLPRGPSALRALARYRGATIGVEYAEAFVLVRELA